VVVGCSELALMWGWKGVWRSGFTLVIGSWAVYTRDEGA
jgi:hypothetical protein